MVRYTLSRQERLSSLKAIEVLFKEGHSLSKYPIRLVWSENPLHTNGTMPVQVMFSISKKKYPRAVDRNRVKRLMRENYRLMKPGLYTLLPEGKSFHLAFIYTGTEVLDFQSIQKGIDLALKGWLKKISSVQSPTQSE